VFVSPADSTADVPMTVTFTWKPSVRATSYTLTVTGGIKPNHEVVIVNTSDTFAIVNLSYYCSGYNWYVIAYNNEGSSDISDTWNFSTLMPPLPDAPVPALPLDSVIDMPLSNTFTWTRPENAEKYYLFITTGSAAGDIMVNQVVTTDTFTVASVPSYNTVYKWWVVAQNCGGKSTDSEKRTFTTMLPPPPPEAPILASPLNGDTITIIIMPRNLLHWYPSEGATQYSVYVSTTPDNTGIVYNSTVADTFSTCSLPYLDTTYYWCIRACNPYSCSGNSEIWSFFYSALGKKSSEPLLSDSLYKINQIPLTDALSKVILLNGIYFNWNTALYPELEDTTRQIGFIAQEVQPVIPEVVSSDKNGISYIDYNRMVPVLTEAIKELKNQNDSLQTIISSYETRFQNIEAMLANCCSQEKSMQTDINATIQINSDATMSKANQLYQNRPNPFNVTTTFTYTLGEGGNVELIIEDSFGRLMTTLVNQKQRPGDYSIDWDAENITSGIYFYSLKVNGIVLVKKAIKL